MPMDSIPWSSPVPAFYPADDFPLREVLIVTLPTRSLGPFTVSAIGLGCMNVSHAYGTPPARDAAEALLRQAFDAGVTHFDTAALYGFGKNEEVVGAALKPVRGQITLASKCGMTGVDGKRVIDGRPETLKATCEASLTRLQTDVIDLYTLHRWDKQVPIEDSVGALADLVKVGKIKAIGLSEVSSETLRRAHAVHPIAAVQSEYSLWTRDPETRLLAACAELGAAFVAFSPVGRGILAGGIAPQPNFAPGDIRLSMPRFADPNLAANLAQADRFAVLVRSWGYSPAQAALAWLLAKATHILPIPGTANPQHLTENISAAAIVLTPEQVVALEALYAPDTVQGPRYAPAVMAEIDRDAA